MLMRLTADGRCIFEVTKSSNVAVGIASMQYMRAAATALRDTCLANGEKNGGIAVGLGASCSIILYHSSPFFATLFLITERTILEPHTHHPLVVAKALYIVLIS